MLVFARDAAVLLRLANVVDGVAAAVADGDARLLGALVDLLDEAFASLLGELRKRESDAPGRRSSG